MAENAPVAPRAEDRQFETVYSYLSEIPDFEIRAALTLREAISDVLRGEKTGRYSIAQLTKQEKAHIGTQVEIAFRIEFFGLREGNLLDTTVDGIEVDIKNTIGSNWMIPREAVGQLCLLVQIDEANRCFSIGLLRTAIDSLNKPNQDGKRSINSQGQGRIRWVVRNAELPVSIFVTLPEQIRSEIWAQKGRGNKAQGHGQARVTHLFRMIQNQPIFRADIATLAQQRDPAKRARDAKKKLRREGLLVLSHRYDRRLAKEKGFDLKEDEWISIPES